VHTVEEVLKQILKRLDSMDQHQKEFRSEFQELRSETAGKFKELRDEVALQFSRMEMKLDNYHTEMRSGFKYLDEKISGHQGVLELLNDDNKKH
jgi:hypothetical protein